MLRVLSYHHARPLEAGDYGMLRMEQRRRRLWALISFCWSDRHTGRSILKPLGYGDSAERCSAFTIHVKPHHALSFPQPPDDVTVCDCLIYRYCILCSCSLDIQYTLLKIALAQRHNTLFWFFIHFRT